MASERLAFAGKVGGLGGYSEIRERARKVQIYFCDAGKSVLVGNFEEPCAFSFFELVSTEKQVIGALACNNRCVFTGRKRPLADSQFESRNVPWGEVAQLLSCATGGFPFSQAPGYGAAF